MNQAEDIKGCRVLIVEDDGMLSMLVQDLLAEMGCEVVDNASRFEEAVRKCNDAEFDVALLDINLRGEHTTPIAEAMRKRGQPFVLTTGYGESILSDALRAVPLLQKPYRRQDLEIALWDALHSR